MAPRHVDPLDDGLLLRFHAGKRIEDLAVDRLDRAQDLELVLVLLGRLDERLDVLGEARAAVADAREEEARPDALVPAHAEEAFVIGLLQDCGMLLLVQLLGDDYAALCGLQDLSPTAFYLEEGKRFSHPGPG